MPDLRDIYNDQFVANDWAHYLICKVQPNKDVDETLAILVDAGIKLKPLKAVVTYIKTNFAEKYPVAVNGLTPKKANVTKTELFNQIITFVQITLGHLCLKCTSPYFPYNDENRPDGVEVKCHICSLPAHKDCIKEEHLQLGSGIVFLCQQCVIHKGKTTVIVDDASAKPPLPPPAKEEKDSETDTSSDSENENSSKDKKKERKKKSKPTHKNQHNSDSEEEPECLYEITENTCKFFLKTSCKSGLLGRNCKFDHLPTCNKLMRHGIRGPQGCKLGGDCQYYHPHMCRESLNFKTCSRQNCRYYHVKGTVHSDGFSAEQNATEEAATYQSNAQVNPQQNHISRQPREQEPVRRENSDFLEAIKKLEGFIVNIQEQLSQQQKQIQQLPAATVQYRAVPQMATVQTQPLHSMSNQFQPNQYIQHQYPTMPLK